MYTMTQVEKIIKEGTITQRSLLYLTHFALSETLEHTPTMINRYLVDDDYLKTYRGKMPVNGLLSEDQQTELFDKIDKSNERHIYYNKRKLYAVLMWYKEQTERHLLKLHQDINILTSLVIPFYTVDVIQTVSKASIKTIKKTDRELTHLGMTKDLTPTEKHLTAVKHLIERINEQTEEAVCYINNLKEIATNRLPLKFVSNWATIEKKLLEFGIVSLHCDLRNYRAKWLDREESELIQPEQVKYEPTPEDIDCIMKTEL